MLIMAKNQGEVGYIPGGGGELGGECGMEIYDRHPPIMVLEVWG